MKLTGNEKLGITFDFFQEMQTNYEELVASSPTAFKSAVFSREQISACLTEGAVGIGFIRVVFFPQTPDQMSLYGTDVSLVATTVQNNGTIVQGSGVMPTSTCPKHCNLVIALEGFSNIERINDADLALGKANIQSDDILNIDGIYVGEKAINAILSQEECQGIKVSFVQSPNEIVGVSICGVDISGQPQVSHAHLIVYSDLKI